MFRREDVVHLNKVILERVSDGLISELRASPELSNELLEALEVGMDETTCNATNLAETLLYGDRQ